MQMAIWNRSLPHRALLAFALVAAIPAGQCAAQAAPAASPATRQLGTVKAITGEDLTVSTDAGQTVTITVPATARVMQLAVGSTDLKTAKPGQFSDIGVGDRVLASGAPGTAPASLTARLVVIMKSSDIAKMQAEQEAEWRTNGVGGIVSSVDPATGAIVVGSGAKKITIHTSSKTVFRRFSADSVKYQDAKLGSLAEIHPKDQLQARGEKSADGMSVEAEEVVSGSFLNLSGLISSIDASTGTITLKDLATKRTMTVKVTENSRLHSMPLEMATRFAARSNGGGQAASKRSGEAGNGDSAGMRRSAGADLSQMISRLPTITPADLKKGDAVMIVASEPTPGASTVTAVTVLTGVDPILTANPNGGMDLSMNMGSGPSAE